MKSYQHSRVFEAYKGTKEAITNNLTSLEYLQTLDYLLWHALEPIYTECPILFTNYLAKVVAWQSLKTSTKFTSDERQVLPIKLFNALTLESTRKSYDCVRDMRINRGLLFGFIAFFGNSLKRYERLHSPFYTSITDVERATEISKIEQQMGLRPKGNLYAALQQVKHWETEARAFKAKIVEKYTRMALLQAKSAYTEYNHEVPLDDVVQIYLLTVNRAIDRCDSRQGVLTTFIQSWFKSAKSEVARLSKGQHDQSYEALGEKYGDAASDILGVVLPDLDAELKEHCAFVAKQVDPNGYLRAHLGIPEFVTLAQRQMLELLADEEAFH